MKIGIFDSGLGGLIVAKSIRKLMPEYDYVYLGDTKRVPYGNRSFGAIYEFSKQGVDYLFRKEHCAIVIVACNTASARALGKLQENYLPKNFPNRKILGVLVPAAEEGARYARVGVLGTYGTVNSRAYPDEIGKIKKSVRVFQNPAPLLVPLAEEGETILVREFLKKYLKPLLDKKIQALVLGCTHYPIFKREIRKISGKGIKVLSQDEIVPKKLKDYFARHPEIVKKLSKNKSAKILVTDTTQTIDDLSKKWFGRVKPKLIKL